MCPRVAAWILCTAVGSCSIAVPMRVSVWLSTYVSVEDDRLDRKWEGLASPTPNPRPGPLGMEAGLEPA